MQFCAIVLHHRFNFQKFLGMTRSIVTCENKTSYFLLDCLLAHETSIVFNRVGNGRLEVPPGLLY